jgi:hypothetical protein
MKATKGKRFFSEVYQHYWVQITFLIFSAEFHEIIIIFQEQENAMLNAGIYNLLTT